MQTRVTRLCTFYCVILDTEKFKEEKAMVAHVVINVMDKEKALLMSMLCDVLVKPYR